MCSFVSNTGKKLHRLSCSAIGGQSRVSRLNKSATLGQLHQISWNHIQPHGIWWKNRKIEKFWVLNKHSNRTEGDGKRKQYWQNDDLSCPTPARLNLRGIFVYNILRLNRSLQVFLQSTIMCEINTWIQTLIIGSNNNLNIGWLILDNIQINSRRILFKGTYTTIR